MSRKLKIATTSLATLEDNSPPFNLRYPDPADTLNLGLSMLDGAGAQGADLALLPEGFMAAGLPIGRIPDLAVSPDGPEIAAVADRARNHDMYVVAGFYTRENNHFYNRALLFDRSGELAGSYAKRHPTDSEIKAGVLPGTKVPVFDTDFGRIGLSVCFDLNWPEDWAEMKKAGAELICWISAYEGGFPLQAYAWMHRLVIVTSVWPYHARVIERSGRIVAEASRWGRLALANIDLDQRLLHAAELKEQILPILTRYGEKVRIETFNDEHLFTLETTDPDLNVQDIIGEYGLIEYQPYLDRCARMQEDARQLASR